MRLKKIDEGFELIQEEKKSSVIAIKRYSPKVNIGEYFILLNCDDVDVAEKARDYCLSTKSKYKKGVIACSFENYGGDKYKKEGLVKLETIDGVNLDNYKKIVDNSAKKLNKEKRVVIDKKIADMSKKELERFREWERSNLR